MDHFFTVHFGDVSLSLSDRINWNHIFCCVVDIVSVWLSTTSRIHILCYPCFKLQIVLFLRFPVEFEKITEQTLKIWTKEVIKIRKTKKVWGLLRQFFAVCDGNLYKLVI